MEAGLFSRFAMAGWVFMVVFVASLWHSNSPAWTNVSGLLLNKDVSAVPLAAFGAIVGLSAPPALGFVLMTLATSLYRLVPLDRMIRRRAVTEVDERQLRVLFYSLAGEGLVQRRQVYMALA